MADYVANYFNRQHQQSTVEETPETVRNNEHKLFISRATAPQLYWSEA